MVIDLLFGCVNDVFSSSVRTEMLTLTTNSNETEIEPSATDEFPVSTAMPIVAMNKTEAERHARGKSTSPAGRQISLSSKSTKS